MAQVIAPVYNLWEVGLARLRRWCMARLGPELCHFAALMGSSGLEERIILYRFCTYMSVRCAGTTCSLSNVIIDQLRA
jgi:hypothetical protein